LNPNPRKHDRVQGNIQSMLQPAVTTKRSVIEVKEEVDIHGGSNAPLFYVIIKSAKNL